MYVVHAQASDRVYYVHQTLVDAEAALVSSETSNGAPEQDCSELEGIINSVQAALCDDLNTPQAIALLSEPLKMLNDLLHTKKVGTIVCMGFSGVYGSFCLSSVLLRPSQSPMACREER